MTIAFSREVANARLDAIEATIGQSPFLRIYSGSTPADCSAGIGAATLLAEYVLPTDWLTRATNNVKSRDQISWQTVTAINTGTAQFFRIYEDDGVTCDLQGSVSLPGGGGNLQFPSVSFVTGYTVLINWFVLRDAGGPLFYGALSATLSNSTTLGLGSVYTASWTSTEYGRTAYGNDWPHRSATAPTTGVLFSCWVKLKDAVTYPIGRGNAEVCTIRFANWYMRCITGNFNWTSVTNGDLNSNSMLFCDGTAVGENPDTYVSDTTWLLDTGVPGTYENGWIFVAWQFSCDGSGNLTLNQWIRYAGQSMQGPYTSTYTLAALRSALVTAGWTSPHANAYTPSTAAADIQICGGNGENMYYIHARVEDTATVPSNAYLLGISNLTAADTTAWADWSLEWSGGASDITDRSGHGRDLSSMGGTFYAGTSFP